MVNAVLLCAALMSGQTATPDADAMAVYQAAKAEAGRDPEAHVRLALWCEAHGLKAERLKHLAIAVLTNPSHTTARGLMGLVADHGHWRRPEEITARIKTDEELAVLLSEYNTRRDRINPKDADDHWRLGVWCDENGLDAEAKAHFTAVTRLDPGRDAAWKRLGFEKHQGRWTTQEQIDAQIAEREAREKANRHWRPLLTHWKEALRHSDPALRDEARTGLAGVSDPRAVASILRVFGTGNPRDQLNAVQLLGQIDAPAASRSLAMFAVLGTTEEVRRRATETLVWRDPQEFVSLLVSGIRTPSKYEIQPGRGPGSKSILVVEGERFNLQRSYQHPELPRDMAGPRAIRDSFQRDPVAFAAYQRLLSGQDDVPLNPAVMSIVQQVAVNPSLAPTAFAAVSQANPVIQGGTNMAAVETAKRRIQDEAAVAGALTRIRRNINEFEKANYATNLQIQNDVAYIERSNAVARQVNARILPVLDATTGQELGDDHDAWQTWWTDQQGYAYQPPAKLTFAQAVPQAYNPQYTAVRVHHNCFARGTLVRTLDGLTPIETLRSGDRVLAQDVTTGSLTYQPILAVFHNAPNETLRVGLEGGETVVSTLIHRYWKAGKGWVMARDLKPGDVIRTVGGTAKVVSVSAGEGPAGLQPGGR